MDNKEFREERFEFALYVNNNVICKRNFKINNFIEGSMNTLDFKNKIDEIVDLIDSDLKSKSRVYTWYYYDSENPDSEFTEPLLEPWACTFKFVITDNGNEVISKIWDGYGYPKSVREKVDIANKTVKILTKDGNVFSYDKEAYFKANEDRLSPELYVLKAQISDKQDLLLAITKKICEMCSPRENMYNKISDYTLSNMYKNKIYEYDENGNFKLNKYNKRIVKQISDTKKFYYSSNLQYKKFVNDWGKDLSKKTEEYFKNLF